MGEKKMDAESTDAASFTAPVRTALLYHRPTGVPKTTVRTKEDMVRLGAKPKKRMKMTL